MLRQNAWKNSDIMFSKIDPVIQEHCYCKYFPSLENGKSFDTYFTITRIHDSYLPKCMECFGEECKLRTRKDNVKREQGKVVL